MKANYKNKVIIKTLSFILIIFLLCFLIIKVIVYNKSYDINIKIVDNINSELYELVTFYDYNELTLQYEITEQYVSKENILYTIFNYYNLEYSLDSLVCENGTLNIILNDNVINITDFKKMKLSCKCLHIDKIILNYNNKIIEI